MLYRVSELEGLLLDQAVAKCEGISALEFLALLEGDQRWQYCYSTDWAQGGPIIDRLFGQGLIIRTNEHLPSKDGQLLIVASLSGAVHAGFYFGPTALIAAMRCYVASKFGNEIEL